MADATCSARRPTGTKLKASSASFSLTPPGLAWRPMSASALASSAIVQKLPCHLCPTPGEPPVPALPLSIQVERQTLMGGVRLHLSSSIRLVSAVVGDLDQQQGTFRHFEGATSDDE